MARQLTFDLPLRPALGRDDFFVSAANAHAVAQIDGWRDWAFGKLILAGPAGAGKTHLAHVWAEDTGARMIAAAEIDASAAEHLADAPAVVVEDAEALAGHAAREEALFHLHNALVQTGAPLLLTARAAPARWGLRLPDLASRMGQAGVALLEPPDDALLMAVMMKRAVDRQLALSPRILAYAAPRLERSFAAAEGFVARLDALSLRDQRKPTMAHATAALEGAREGAQGGTQTGGPEGFGPLVDAPSDPSS